MLCTLWFKNLHEIMVFYYVLLDVPSIAIIFTLCNHHKFNMGQINNENPLKFVHLFIHLTRVHKIICWKHIWHMDKCVDGWSTNLWMNKCYMNFTSSNKSMCQMYFQCTISMHEMYELWMNKFCTTSITKLWDVKFVINILCILNGFAKKWTQKCQIWLCTNKRTWILMNFTMKLSLFKKNLIAYLSIQYKFQFNFNLILLN